MRISSLTLGLVDTNTYFIENDKAVILIDPSGESEKIIKKLNQINKPLKAILLTHAHFDHIGAVDDIVDRFDVPVYMHEAEFDFLKDPVKNGADKFKQYGLPIITSKVTPEKLNEGSTEIEGFKFNVLHTPGHSPGSLTYVFDEFAVVGDTLFNNGIGRTDLYKGDYETLVDSIQEIINKAIEMKASDVHFIPVKNEVSIKFRINDNLEQYEQIGNSIYQKLLVYMKFQAGLDVSTQQVAQSGRYSYHFNKIYFLRISTLPLSLGQESCVIRIVPQFFQQQKSTYKFNDFKHLMNKKQGLLLFSGPTGSGKSTLMYQMVSYANKALNLNVISIEDPVEMQIPGIVQINVNDKAGINYVNSFKAILRCDPDVILIGEIRDKDVAKCVIQASLSGHLVLTTLHATDCKGAILRLLEMGISVQELIQATNLIINQRLVTTIKQQRQLVCEILSQQQLRYFFSHNHSLPSSFKNLEDKLDDMTKAGVICETTMDKYI